MSDVEQNLPFPIEKLLKTLVFRTRDSKWIYAVVKGRDKVDYKQLSSTLGISRGEISRPSSQEVESFLSLQIGGICPIPIHEDIIVIFDASLVDLGIVYCGVGSNDRSLEIKVDDLARIARARISPIAQEAR